MQTMLQPLISCNRVPGYLYTFLQGTLLVVGTKLAGLPCISVCALSVHLCVHVYGLIASLQTSMWKLLFEHGFSDDLSECRTGYT